MGSENPDPFIYPTRTWELDLASGLRPSFKAISHHEGLTVARFSQTMMLA